ncbi:E3 ubiquitin-protein ligase [Apostasia shenzhenica]|uniref:E3 ubiquitin-protein ligase n=1 Tax=Apostasia shenzhenica TaxID=1088818 RepID=A0A2I0B9N1_9ASPA|nr:E3 ubiquitin-protein ligase [Apostasia shenzhenica]
MAANLSLEQSCEGQTDRFPLLMERPIESTDIVRNGIASATSHHENGHSNVNSHSEERPAATAQNPSSQTSSRSHTASNTRNAPFDTRGDVYGRRHRSPLNSGFWISVELFVNLIQITAAVIVLCFSRHEHPKTPLFAWIIGYTVGCVATIPHLCWRYIHRNIQASEQDSTSSFQNSLQNNVAESGSYTVISVGQTSGENMQRTVGGQLERQQNLASTRPRLNLNALVDHFKMALDCFFAVWFVVGNVWIFGGRSSASDAPNLYWLCVVFLTFSCIGYAMPFILCAIICCCLPCIISLMGWREEMVQTRGATSETINALPTHKFKAKIIHGSEESEMNPEGEGGFLVTGPDKERTISAEDAVSHHPVLFIIVYNHLSALSRLYFKMMQMI